MEPKERASTRQVLNAKEAILGSSASGGGDDIAGSIGMSTPNVCILMSTYNGEQHLSEQLASISSQRGVSISLLVRDDGSTDQTIALLENSRAAFDDINVIKGVNLGARKSFRELLMSAPVSPYYACADQDDIWYDDKLLTGVNAISNETGPALYMCNQRCVDSSGKSLGIRLPDTLIQPSYLNTLFGNQYAGCTMVFNRQLLSKVKEVYQAGGSSLDIIHDALLLLVAQLVGVVVYDPVPHMAFRRHAGTYSDAELYSRKSVPGKVKVACRKAMKYVGRAPSKGYLSNVCSALCKCLGNELPQQALDDLRYIANYSSSIDTWLSFLIGNRLKSYFPEPRYSSYLKILTRTF